MYRQWLGWLAEVSTEITHDAQVEELRKKKRDLNCEICHLEYKTMEFYSLYSQATLALGKARYNREITEYRLACLDGRLTVYEAFEAESTKDKNIKTMLSQMSGADRQKLLEELEGMEE